RAPPVPARRPDRSRELLERLVRDVVRSPRHSRPLARQHLPRERLLGSRRDARAGDRATAGGGDPRRTRHDAGYYGVAAVAVRGGGADRVSVIVVSFWSAAMQSPLSKRQLR